MMDSQLQHDGIIEDSIDAPESSTGGQTERTIKDSKKQIQIPMMQS